MTRDEARAVRRVNLDSGLRAVVEPMPDVRSVAVGFWVDVGSRDEAGPLAGATHFLEHLLFKGTDQRSAREIAESVESVGGDMNAFTAREYTAYYIRVPDEHLDLALDVLSDIVWAPAFRGDEIESERQVILEEIRMRDDTPDDLVHDLFGRAMFPEPLGREVVGSPETIGAMTRDDIAGYHADHYLSATVVAAVAGNADPDRVAEGVEARFAGRQGTFEREGTDVSAVGNGIDVVRRATEQAHLVVGVEALSRDDPDRFALSVLNQALGGGMSSRLFQEIREERGLAYSVYSYRQGFVETGMLAVYAGTAPHQARDVVKHIHDQFDRLIADRGLPADELQRSKSAIKGHLALSLESPASRMNRIGRAEVTTGEVLTVDDLIERVNAVESDDVARVVDRVLSGRPRTLAAIGPFDADDLVG